MEITFTCPEWEDDNITDKSNWLISTPVCRDKVASPTRKNIFLW